MRKSVAVAPLVIPYIVVTVLWFIFAVMAPLPFWQETGDYPWYSLSHAFTLEAKSIGQPAYNIGYNGHPAIPFGILSWIAFRLTTFDIAGAKNRILYVIGHAETYWLYAKFFALLLNLAGVYLLQIFLKRAALIGILVYFAIVPAAISTSLVQLTNESFCLVFVTMFYAVTYRFLVDPARDRDLTAACAGALAVFGWSIKIYYLAPPLALVVGSLVAGFGGYIRWGILLRSYAIALAAFLIFGAVLVYFTMGFSGLLGWATWNWNMLSHVDRYGSGQAGLFSFAAMFTAFVEISTETSLRFPIVFLSLAALSAFAVARNYASSEWRAKYLPFCIAMTFGVLISLFGLLKHYSPLSQHYVLPLCATLSCLLVIINQGISPSVRQIGTGVMCLLLALNLIKFTTIHGEERRSAILIAADADKIAAMPLAPGERRIWGYFSATQQGILPMIVQYSGSSYVSETIFGTAPQDTTPIMDGSAKDWKYVVFPKTYYPTLSSVRQNYEGMFDFATTNFRIADSDKIMEVGNFFVLIRPEPTPPQ